MIPLGFRGILGAQLCHTTCASMSSRHQVRYRDTSDALKAVQQMNREIQVLIRSHINTSSRRSRKAIQVDQVRYLPEANKLIQSAQDTQTLQDDQSKQCTYSIHYWMFTFQAQMRRELTETKMDWVPSYQHHLVSYRVLESDCRPRNGGRSMIRSFLCSSYPRDISVVVTIRCKDGVLFFSIIPFYPYSWLLYDIEYDCSNHQRL